MTIIDGKAVSAYVKESIKSETAELKSKGRSASPRA